ncbi:MULTISPECIES: hypothetical protein [unclassified Akkermansia]|uniref:hypothetical protein n=1 Tax=unclassified Akkermansia TaxID=2608915 RepID=UPI00129B7F33|nr:MULTISPECIES: hypothetical protein [unclassified Akkermansia]
MKTCIECTYWSQFDGCCWCSHSLNYLNDRDGDANACEDFKIEEIEQEAENEDDA